MKATMIVITMAAVGFVAGMVVSCAPSGGQAPVSVPPVQTGGSYISPEK